MEHKTKVMILGVVGVIAGADLLWRWLKLRQLAIAASVPATTQSDQQADPFLASMLNPNAAAVQQTVAQPFQSNINVNVTPNIAQYLTNHYIPLFGFVGFGGHP